MRPKLHPRDEEFLLEFLHPRQICQLLAVWRGSKPTTWIESIEIRAWDGFLKLINRMNLCCSYEASGGRALVEPCALAEAPGGMAGPMFVPEQQWNEVLRKGVPYNFTHLDAHSPPAQPTASLGTFAPAYVARTVDDLLNAMRMRETHDTAGMGRAFGYPGCCIAEYNRAGGGAQARNEFNRKLLQECLDQAMPPQMWATYHVPCSPACLASARLAASYLGAVRSCSHRLYDRVMAGLALSRLSYSISERFVDILETAEDDMRGQALKGSVMGKVTRFIKQPEEVILATATRPLSYAHWQEPPYRVRLIPGGEGLKWIAYRTGGGALVMDANTLDVEIFVDIMALPPEQRPHAETAFHIFRCRTSDRGARRRAGVASWPVRGKPIRNSRQRLYNTLPR